jgi:hypothetical protein
MHTFLHWYDKGTNKHCGIFLEYLIDLRLSTFVDLNVLLYKEIDQTLEIFHAHIFALG